MAGSRRQEWDFGLIVSDGGAALCSSASSEYSVSLHFSFASSCHSHSVKAPRCGTVPRCRVQRARRHGKATCDGTTQTRTTSRAYRDGLGWAGLGWAGRTMRACVSSRWTSLRSVSVGAIAPATAARLVRAGATACARACMEASACERERAAAAVQRAGGQQAKLGGTWGGGRAGGGGGGGGGGGRPTFSLVPSTDICDEYLRAFTCR